MKRVYRSRTDKKVAGIFGGLGELFQIDPTLLRLAAVFVGVATGLLPLLLAYLVGWILIPVNPASPPPDSQAR
ncbi:MAG TPA: PspC domain-containing protein [Terriglobia bacterium]|nr:PspC domain-containing protein [Terriglobia bacterium]